MGKRLIVIAMSAGLMLAGSIAFGQAPAVTSAATQTAASPGAVPAEAGAALLVQTTNERLDEEVKALTEQNVRLKLEQVRLANDLKKIEKERNEALNALKLILKEDQLREIRYRDNIAGLGNALNDLATTNRDLMTRIEEQQLSLQAATAKPPPKEDRGSPPAPAAAPAGKKQTAPPDRNWHYNQGVICQEAGLWRKALGEYKKAIELDPDDADAHFNMAYIYETVYHDRHNAILHYRRYLELKPDAKDSAQVKKTINEMTEEQGVWDHPNDDGIKERLGRW